MAGADTSCAPCTSSWTPTCRPASWASPLASLGLGWVGEPAFAHLLEPVLASFGIQSPALVHGIAFFTAFFIISYLHIVIGELAPKSRAIRKPELLSL